MGRMYLQPFEAGFASTIGSAGEIINELPGI
jgi:hypothetical protein